LIASSRTVLHWTRVARWSQIWVNLLGACNGRGWYILWPFGIFVGYLYIFPVLVSITEENLATLHWTIFGRDYISLFLKNLNHFFIYIKKAISFFSNSVFQNGQDYTVINHLCTFQVLRGLHKCNYFLLASYFLPTYHFMVLGTVSRYAFYNT
jgi:hypothetical protein